MSGSRDPEDAKFVLIVAGEASADRYGADLVKALRGLDPTIRFSGIGGPAMAGAGVEILFHASDMAVVGLTEVLKRAWIIGRAMRAMKAILRRRRPNLLVLIDYPGFNLHIAGQARKAGVPVLYYVSPQVWAWRGGRVRKIRDRVDRMALILPFEEAFYRDKGIRATYVGHPLLEGPGSHETATAGRWNPGATAEGGAPVLGLIPGSRKEEIRRLLPVMVEAAGILKRERYPGLRCLLPLAPTIDRQLVEGLIAGADAQIRVETDIYEVLGACDAAMVTSGTATLETALMGVPMVIVYRVSRLSHWIGRRVVKVPFIGLVNLVAGEAIVAELIQDEVTPERTALETRRLLEDPDARERVMEGLRRVRALLGSGGASARTAQIAMEMMEAQDRDAGIPRVRPGLDGEPRWPRRS